jgi:hypothetical protein
LVDTKLVHCLIACRWTMVFWSLYSLEEECSHSVPGLPHTRNLSSVLWSLVN